MVIRQIASIDQAFSKTLQSKSVKPHHGEVFWRRSAPTVVIMMNFFIKRTFRRFPIIVKDFMNSLLPTFQSLHLEYQLVGPCQPNYANDNQESPKSVFDEVILQMAAPKSKVTEKSDNILTELNRITPYKFFLPLFRERFRPQGRK